MNIGLTMAFSYVSVSQTGCRDTFVCRQKYPVCRRNKSSILAYFRSK
jgi:hypothetical protein